MRSRSQTAEILSLSFACLLLLAGGCSKPLTDAEHLARAESAREEGDRRTAVIELKNALRQNPRNIEARRLLGEIYVEMGDGAAAEKELKKAVELGLAREAVALPLARALRLQNKYEELLTDIPLPSTLGEDQLAWLYTYRGDAWLSLGKIDKAETNYQKALALVAEFPPAELGLAHINLTRGDTNTAERIITDVLKRNTQEALAWRLQALIEQNRNHLEKAEAAYSRAIEYAGTLPDHVQRALIRLRLGRIQEAKEDLKTLESQAPEHYLTHYVNGLIALAERRYEDSQHALEEALNANPNHPESQYFLGIAHQAQGHVEQADRLISKIVATYPHSINARQALALIKLQQKQFDQAKKVLQPILQVQPNDPTSLQLIATAEMELGNHEAAIQYLQRLFESDPESEEYARALGYGYLAIGKESESIPILRQVLEKDPDSLPAVVGLAFAYLREGNVDAATPLIDRIGSLAPDSVLYYSFQGFLHLARHDPKTAKSYFRQGLEKHPANPELVHSLAQLALRENDAEKAKRLYQQALEKHPNHLLTRLRLAHLAKTLGDWDLFVSQLQAAHRNHPKAPEPVLALAHHYIKTGQPDRAQTLLNEILDKHSDNPTVIDLLAQAQLAAEQPARALETAKHLVQLLPDAPHAYHLLAQAYSALRNFPQAQQAIWKALEKDPNYLPSQVALVRLLLYQGKSSEAKRRLNHLLAAHPDNRWVLETAGWAALGTGELKKAVGFFRTLAERHPSSENTANLAGALWRAGQREEALQVLERWNSQHPKDNRIRYLRVGFHIDRQEKGQAIRLLEELLRHQPDHVLALNDLAWLITDTDPKRAKALMAKAVELAPKATAIRDSQAMLLLEQGYTDKALDILRSLATIDQNPEIRYHLIQALVKKGEFDEAKRLADELEKVSPRFHDELKKLLKP